MTPPRKAPQPRWHNAEFYLVSAFFGLAALSTYLFYALNSGITITNDGSHFALFDALVTTGSPELPNVRQFAFGDSALYDGRYYSDRNPGLALLTYAAYQGLEPLQAWVSPLYLDPHMARRFTPDQALRIPIVMLVPALSGALLLAAMFALGRLLGYGVAASAVAAVSLCAGTLLLRYSTLFYSHITAAALMAWALYLVFRGRRAERPSLMIAGVGLLSTAVLVEHLLLLVFAPVGVYLLICARTMLARPAVLAGTLGAGVAPMLVLMSYNYVCFDSPFSLAHFHHSTDTANHSLWTLFQVDRTLDVLGNLFFGAPKAEVGRQDLTGFLSASPFLVFLLLPLARLAWPGDRLCSEQWVLLAGFCLVALGAASVFAPYGGWDRDYRYFVSAVPLLAPLLAASLQQLMRPGTVRVRCIRISGLVIYVILLAQSVPFHLGHVRHAGQIQYPQPLVNLEAASVNVSLLYLALAAAALALLAIPFALGKLR